MTCLNTIQGKFFYQVGKESGSEYSESIFHLMAVCNRAKHVIIAQLVPYQIWYQKVRSEFIGIFQTESKDSFNLEGSYFAPSKKTLPTLTQMCYFETKLTFYKLNKVWSRNYRIWKWLTKTWFEINRKLLHCYFKDICLRAAAYIVSIAWVESKVVVTTLTTLSFTDKEDAWSQELIMMR